jgi:tRNA threonylcarbamoyladenosine biosynthesis protein TsaE
MQFDFKIYKTFSEEETYELGRNFSKNLKPGDTISLEGDLGTGKTALTKGIAAGLDISEPITSPTFTLVNTYEGRVTLHHFDVYRTEDAEELLAIGWDEYLDGEAVTIVEWGDRIPELLPDDTIYIRLERDDTMPDGRTIAIERRVGL